MAINTDKAKSAKGIDILQAKQTKADTGAKSARRLPGVDKIDPFKLAKYDQEREIVLPPNVKFKISKAETNPNMDKNEDLPFGSPDIEQDYLNLYVQMLKSGGEARSGKASRTLDFEAGVGPSPFAKAKISKLGSSIYDLEKTSGLSKYEFDDAVKFAQTNDLSEDEFKKYLAKRAQDKKSKSDLVLNPETLRQFMLHGTQTPQATPAQMSLADMLKSDKPDPQYDPKYDRKAWGGTVQGFVDGGWVKRMQQHPEAKIKEQLEV